MSLNLYFISGYKNSSLLILFLLSISTFNLKSETLRIAVASNFLETMQRLSQQFEAKTGHSIQLSSGSSGKLYLQISNGAPFDLFLSADSHKPSELVSNNLALESTQQTYALGKLTLWLKNCTGKATLKMLASKAIKKIAIANPKLAPYGSASKQLLERHKLWKAISKKLIYPENIAQVAQFAKLGVIEGALIAESNVKRLENKKGSCFLELQTSEYQAINQQLVILSKSENKRLAEEFVRFLNTNNAKSLIKNMGYLLPNSARIAQ